MNVDVVPEDICLAACQIQGAGTHRAVAGERASFVVEAHDARGNRLVSGEAPLSVIVRTLRGNQGGNPVNGEKREEDVTRGQILDYGNGAYEASYVVRTAGPGSHVPFITSSSPMSTSATSYGPAVVPGCVLLGDAVLDLEVGAKGVFTIERRDAYGNVAPSRQGQVKLRCVADGPGDVDAHVVDCAEGRSEVYAVAKVAGRYFITVVGGDDQVPVPGSPFELVAYPGAAAASASVTSVYGAQLASPDADVLAAVAGDEITLTVSPRDKFGNKTVFGPGTKVKVCAVVDGDERLEFEDRGGPRAEATLRGALTAAGSYLLRATIGDEPLAGYPRILQIVPGATDPRRCVLFGDALAGVERVLLRTSPGHDHKTFDPDFVSLGEEAAKAVAAAGVKLVGIDTPSIDHATDQDLGGHHALYEGGVAILENLDLSDVPEGDYELIALPLRIVGCDSSPVRAVLRELS